jgi:hypothetical protein
MSRHPGKRLLRLGLLLLAGVAIVALAGCALSGLPGAPAAQATPHIPPTRPLSPSSPTPRMAMPPQVTSPLGPPPSNCPKGDPVKTLRDTDFGGGFIGTPTFLGASPAWELGFGPNGTFAAQGTPYPASKIMWVVGPNITAPVTLSGHDLRSGTPLWFDIFPPNSAGGTEVFTTSAMLDPANANRGSTTNRLGYWNIWGIGIIVSAASCYQLNITSSVGSWHTVFAAGSISLP